MRKHSTHAVAPPQLTLVSEICTHFTQLIDERAKLVFDAKVNHRVDAEVEIKQVNVNKNEKLKQCSKLVEDRDKNVIIYGLRESDADLVQEIFEVTETTFEPAHAMRLGQRRDDKIRPLMLTMKTKKDKEQFMRKLWILKDTRNRFGKISITEDYTLEERDLIKKWNIEAKRRNQQRTKEYRWTVRGAPRTGVRLIQIKNE